MNTRLFILALAGALFGGGLAISGMTDPARVGGFLDITGQWDPALVFVMAGAVATYGLGMLLWRKRTGGKGWFGTQLPCRGAQPINGRLVLGAAIFGIGWGLGGFCPGPAIANLGAWRIEALLFVPAMALGMLAARFCFGADND